MRFTLRFYFVGNGTSLKNQDLLNVLKRLPPFKPNTKQSKDLLFGHTLETIGLSTLHEKDKISLKKLIQSFCIFTSRNWKKSERHFGRFEQNNHEWLENFVLTSGKNADESSTSEKGPKGRPKKHFPLLSKKAKRRRLAVEVQSKSEEELCLAAEMKLHSLGKRKAASMLHF